MKQYQLLYRVDFCCESRPKLETWSVSTIRRKAHRGCFFMKGKGRKTVFLHLHSPVPSWYPESLRRDNFRLEDWPSKCLYAASESGAWRKALPRVIQDIERHEGYLTDDDFTEEDRVEVRKDLAFLRGNRTIIQKKIKANS